MKASEQKSSKERRSLVAGLNSTSSGSDRAVEEQFVYARKPIAAKPTVPQAPGAESREGKGKAANAVNAVSRMPLTTRITDYATALKRASLERQLSGTVPNTLQDILEEALEPWLRSNGYLN